MTGRQHCKTFNGCQVRTKFLKYTYHFSWSIENYLKWPSGTKLRSPEFNPINNGTFYATLERKTDISYVDDGKSLLTFYLTSETDSLFIKHNVFITDSSGEKIFAKVSVDIIYNHSVKSCVVTFVTNRITEYVKSTKDQILYFDCIMEIDKLSSDIAEKYQTTTPSGSLSILVNDLKSMYTSSLHADINLQVEDSVLRVHRSLLCARSPVFAKMFDSPMEENEKNIVAIPDIKLPAVKNFVEFLYTGKLLEDDFESVYSLYYAADKYDVSSLRKMCVDILLSKMNVENACRVLTLANQHSDVQFKDSAMDFIQFHFDEIVGTDSWEEFLEEETKLAADVMRCLSMKDKKVNDVK